MLRGLSDFCKLIKRICPALERIYWIRGRSD